MIVDDQPPFRAAARAVVDRVDGFELVAEASRARRPSRPSDELRPRPRAHGHQHGRDRRHRGDSAHHRRPSRTRMVILVSTYEADDLPAGARTSGAMAYVNKDELSPRDRPPPLGGRRRPRLAPLTTASRRASCHRCRHSAWRASSRVDGSAGRRGTWPATVVPGRGRSGRRGCRRWRRGGRPCSRSRGRSTPVAAMSKPAPSSATSKRSAPSLSPTRDRDGATPSPACLPAFCSASSSRSRRPPRSRCG